MVGILITEPVREAQSVPDKTGPIKKQWGRWNMSLFDKIG
jgi:hypothetical protein